MRDDAPRLWEGEVLPPLEEPKTPDERRAWAFPEQDGPGQPAKLTPKVLAVMLRARALGSSVTDACEEAGVSRDSHKNWMARGKKDREAGKETIYSEYFCKIPVAEKLGRTARRAFILKKIQDGSEDAIRQANAMLKYEAQMEAGYASAQANWLKRQALRQGAPALPAPSPSAAPPMDMSAFSPEEWKEWEALEAKARADFAGMTQAEVARFQELLRKGRGQDTQDEGEVTT